MGSNRINGLDLLRIIRSNPNNHHLKIIITSAIIIINIFRNALLRADFFIKFPFEIKDIERIYTHLKSLDDYVDLEALPDTINLNG